MPTYGELRQAEQAAQAAEDQWIPIPENVPAGKTAGAGTALAAEEIGNSTLEPSDDERGFQEGENVQMSAVEVTLPADATGTGSHGVAAAAAVEAANAGGSPNLANGVVYKNQNAHRNLELNNKLEADLNEVSKNYGITSEVISGGQHPSRQYGSTRHNHGNSADVQFRDNATGQLLDMRNGADQAKMSFVVRDMVARGWQGVGAGDGTSYMGPNRIHIGAGTPGTWGGGGRGKNAPSWLNSAWQEGRSLGSGPTRGGSSTPSKAGKHTGSIVAVDEAAKVLGPHASVAGAVGFGGAQKDTSIASAAQQTFQAGLGHKPVNWLAKNGPGMAGWQQFISSGTGISNGYLSPIEHLTAWGQSWFRAYPGIPNQLWRGGLGFNNLTNADDLLQQIVTGGQHQHILNSFLGGLGMGTGSSGGRGSSGKGSSSNLDLGDVSNPADEYDEERPGGLPRVVPFYIDFVENNAESALIREAVIKRMPFAEGLKDGLPCCVEDFLLETSNYSDLVSRLIHTGLMNPVDGYERKIRGIL